MHIACAFVPVHLCFFEIEKYKVQVRERERERGEGERYGEIAREMKIYKDIDTVRKRARERKIDKDNRHSMRERKGKKDK